MFTLSEELGVAPVSDGLHRAAKGGGLRLLAAPAEKQEPGWRVGG